MRKRLALQTALAIAAIALLTAAAPAESAPAIPDAAPGLFESALRWASATILVIALLLGAAMILRKGRFSRATENVLSVRHRIALGRGTSIALVEAGIGFVLIGVGADGVNRLREFDGDE